MLLTVAGGAFETFFRDKTKLQEITENPLVEFINKITEDFLEGISEKDKYTIKRIAEGWQQDPLISIALTDQPKQPPRKKMVTPDPNISYTGFMRLGDIKFAIINGTAYTLGDQLARGGYVVSDITPSQLVIVSTGHSKQAYVFLLNE
jgi:hypothetical protein